MGERMKKHGVSDSPPREEIMILKLNMHGPLYTGTFRKTS